MSKRILIIFIIISILSTTFMGIEASAEEDLTTSLKENLIPLETTKAENGFEDLMPLKEILKDKKIIGMGEATHGTSEFFQMKHRMFEFLVEEMGYRIFAIETEFGGAQVINEYILHGKGNMQKCFEAIKMWTWSTQEVEDMIRWMQSYNERADANNKVKFYGYDMQSSDNSIKYILDYLWKVDSDNSDYDREEIMEIGGSYYPNKETMNKLKENIDKINENLRKNKDLYIEKSSEEEYHIISQHSNLIDQFIKVNINKDGFQTRDYYMAQNVKWILEHENTYYGNDKIMLWAHNGHISQKYFGLKTMGKNLKDMYGDKYYPIGFDFYRGSFAALPMTFYGARLGKLASFYISSSPAGSYADEINKTDIPINFLDFRSAAKDQTISELLSSKIYTNNIGAAYWGKLHNINPVNKTILRDYYDGMIFVQETNAAKQKYSLTRELNDGNKLLNKRYTLNIILFLAIIIFLYISRKKDLKEVDLNKFYILGKYREDSAYLSETEKWIIKLNNKINSISPYKYISIVLALFFLVSMIHTAFNSMNTIFDMAVGSKQIVMNILMVSIVGETRKVLFYYIFPLALIKFFSESNRIELKHIIILSIATAIFFSKNYLVQGLADFAFISILSFINSLIYSYTYALFYYKKKKPIVTLFFLAISDNLINILVTFIIYKI